jgi:hypothetical protein
MKVSRKQFMRFVHGHPTFTTRIEIRTSLSVCEYHDESGALIASSLYQSSYGMGTRVEYRISSIEFDDLCTFCGKDSRDYGWMGGKDSYVVAKDRKMVE